MDHQNEYFRGVLDNLFDGIYLVDHERRITFWNKSAEDITGYRRELVIGTRCSDNILVHVDDTGASLCLAQCPVTATLIDGEKRAAAVYLHHRDGHRVPVLVRVAPLRGGAGEITGAAEIFTENSAGLAMAAKIHHLESIAYIDRLTGMPNRRYAEAEIVGSLGQLQRFGWPFGVAIMDVDRFKLVNDRSGHDAGDHALKMVARTLSLNCRSFDLVSRWGGDEFLLLAPNVTAEPLFQLAERLRILVDRSAFVLDTAALGATVSMGATVARPDDTTESLMGRADDLLYRSKESGRNRVTMDEWGVVTA